MSTSNCMCRPYIDTNNTQGMQLGSLKIVPLLALSTFIAPYFHYVIQTRTSHVSIPKRRIQKYKI